MSRKWSMKVCLKLVISGMITARELTRYTTRSKSSAHWANLTRRRTQMESSEKWPKTSSRSTASSLARSSTSWGWSIAPALGLWAGVWRRPSIQNTTGTTWDTILTTPSTNEASTKMGTELKNTRSNSTKQQIMLSLSTLMNSLPTLSDHIKLSKYIQCNNS